MRRRRQAKWALELFSETDIKPKDFILPVFITESDNSNIKDLPGVSYYSLDKIAALAELALTKGIKSILLFPVVEASLKSLRAEHAIDPNNLVARAIKNIKTNVPEIAVIADVALDPYTSHGHDGILNADGMVDNDATNDILCQQALMLANAGVDVVAPSDMMDGRVGQIRQALDDKSHINTLILSYAAKYNSKLYTPFRSALGSKGNLGVKDKSSYQQDIRNSDEAMHEVALDLTEGADWIMIKPGMQNLDIIWRAANEFQVPIAAYQVSGEYSMLADFAQKHQLSFEELQLEAMLTCKRAGAMHIVCYNALQMADYIKL